MSDLRELYPVPKTVPFGSGTVEVTGLSMRKVSALIHEYPDVISIFSGGKVGIETLLAKLPDAALAAFGLVNSDDDKIKAFDNLAFGQQADILGAIYDLTIGGERAGPFLASVGAQLRVGQERPKKASPSNSPSSTSSSAPADTEETSAT